MEQDTRVYEFGPFHIDAVERLLYRGEEMIPLTPKVADTLLALLSNAGRIVEKDDLMKIIWPDSFVDEGGLARNISALRKVLGDGAGEAQYIETIPKRGYRFIAPLKESGAGSRPAPSPEKAVAEGARPAPYRPPGVVFLVLGVLLALVVAGAYLWRTRTPAMPRFRSLLVLPLKNLSNDATQEYVADGITADLINSLAKIEALRVISLTSAMTYKAANKPLRQIARELNVDAVVEGSVLHSGERVQIAVQLFDAKTENQLWAGGYPGDLSDVLNLQNEAATSIAAEIQVKLTPVEKQRLASSRPVNPQAWLDYSRGRFFSNKRTPQGIQGAIDYFRRAIAKDPSYASAHSGLADAYALLGSTGADARPAREVMPLAKQEALQAVKLDGGLAEGHTSLGYVRLSYDWDLDAARSEFEQAIAINPGYATAHHWFAHYWLAAGKPEKALAEGRKAQLLDPYSLVINVGVGWFLYHGRRYNDAIEQYQTTLNMDPAFALAHAVLGMAYEQNRMYARAIEEFNTASALQGSASFTLAGLGCAYGLAGRSREAREVVDRLQQSARTQYVPPTYVAAVYAAMGNNDEAIAWTRKAFDERSDYMIYLKTEPWADSLRSDPRFIQLMRSVGPQRDDPQP